jgi:AcrR family transcriptional regulator
MPRVVKHPDIRREELLGIAASLFARTGYDGTSVDDIIREAGLSKGAFYHYYPSKDALLEALASRAAEQALERLAAVFSDRQMTAIQRLNAFLERGRREEGRSNVAIFSAIFRPENLALYHRLHAAVTRVMVPPLASIIEQGVREGSMKSDYPATTAEIVLGLGAITHDAVADLITAHDRKALVAALAAFQTRLIQQGIAVDRILGLPDGTIAFWDPKFAKQWLDEMQAGPS